MPTIFISPRRRSFRFVSSIPSLLALFIASSAWAVTPGIAPVNPPTGGFHIDGNLEANVTVPGVGDWVPGGSGASATGTGVLTTAGVPLSANTYHLVDLFDNGLDDNFKGGQKFDDNPNSWTWVNNPVTAKTDINHGLMHFTTDPATGHTWVIVGADRRTDNGAAYIDFEFLQNTLTTTNGGFSSAGPNGGRTVNDFLLTLALTNGGGVAEFFVDRWEPIGGGNFGYVDRTAAAAGAVYASTNAGSVPVPFMAFGKPTYDANTFAEGAVDLTALLSAFDPCLSLGVKTLMIKTKTAPSGTATIVDFIAPLQVNRHLGVVDAGVDQAACPDASSSTKFTITGTVTPGPGESVTSLKWELVPGSGTATIDSPTTLSTDVHVTSASATFRLTAVISPGNCNATDEVTVTVKPLETISLSGAGPLCTNGGTVQLNGSPAGGTYSGTGVNPTTGVFNPATSGAGSFLITYSFTATNGCSGSAQTTIQVKPAPAVTLDAAGPLCSNGATITLNGLPSGGTYSGTGVNPSTGVFNPQTSGQGSFDITYTVTVNGCTDKKTITIQVKPAPAVTLGAAGPLCSNGATITLNGLPSGGTYSGTGVNPSTGVFNPQTSGQGSFDITYTVTVNGCTDKKTITIQVKPAPAVTLDAAGPLCSNGATITLNGLPSGGTYSGTGVNPSTGVFNPQTSGQGSFDITYTVTVNGCTDKKTITIQVKPAPAVTLDAAGPLCSNGATITLNGLPSGGTYSGTGVNPSTGVFNPQTSGQGSFDITYTVTVNGCTDKKTITIQVKPAPAVTLGAAGPLCSNGATITLNGLPSGGTYSGTGVNPSTGVFNPQTSGQGSFDITYTVTVNGCTDKKTITIQVKPAPAVTLGAAGPLCSNGATITLNGLPSGGTYSGTGVNPSTGVFNPQTSGPGSFDITYTVTVNGCTDKKTITIQVSPVAIADAGLDRAVCADFPLVSLAGTISGAATSASWSGGAGTFNPSRLVLNPKYTPSQAEIDAGSVMLTLITNDPEGACGPASDPIKITIDRAATVSAGPAPTVCANTPQVTLAGSIGGAATSASWNGGAGTFNPSRLVLNPTYTPSQAEIDAGSVMLTLITNDPAGACGPALSRLVIRISAQPPCEISGPSAIATGDHATFCAPTEADVSYVWNGPGVVNATAQCIQATQAGTYTLTVTDNVTHCVKTCTKDLILVPCACNVGYPDNSNPPRSAVLFDESEVLRAYDPGPTACGSAEATIKLWYNDEHALTLGVRRVIVKTPSGTTTRDYPIEPTPATTACVLNPKVGTTYVSGDTTGNDVAAGGGRPTWPALFITDLTVNGNGSRAGDWQQGGVGVPPHKVCGTWKGAVRTVDKTHNPVVVSVKPDADPAKNNWTLGTGSDAPPGGFASLKNEGYGAECVWFVSQLGLIKGHTYRMYVMVHDGDQNKTGGDAGHGCTTVHISETGAVEVASATSEVGATSTEATVLAPEAMSLPKQFALYQNSPNPFSAATAIRYALPQRSRVQVTVVDLLGRVIATLVDREEDPGVHTVTWRPADRSGRDLPPGVYLYRMQAVSESTHDYHTIKKMLFVR